MVVNVTESGFSYSGKDHLEAMRCATRYNAFLVRLIERFVLPGNHVLDFGAGMGLFADAIRSSGTAVSCLEVDAALATDLSRRGFTCVRTPEELADESLDYIYSLNVLEHIDDDAAALAALRPKLRRGGRCLIYVPAFPILYSEMDRLVGHHRRYTATTLADVLARSGFQVEHVEYVDSLGFPASLAYKMLGGNGTLRPESVATYDRWIFPASMALDRVTRRWIGKNVFAVARKG